MLNSLVKQLLTGAKYDGVVEAVHYTQDGNVDWVRAYERRGPTWSDHVLLDRKTLIARLKAGKRFFTGQRINYQASEFDAREAVRLFKSKVGEVLVTGDRESEKDLLEGVPAI